MKKINILLIIIILFSCNKEIIEEVRPRLRYEIVSNTDTFDLYYRGLRGEYKHKLIDSGKWHLELDWIEDDSVYLKVKVIKKNIEIKAIIFSYGRIINKEKYFGDTVNIELTGNI